MKHAGGRPTKYKKEFADLLPELFKDGASVVEVCVELGIRKSTFYDFVKDHKEFSNAYVDGLERSEAWWQKLGRAGSAGGRVNPPMWRMNMMNRFKWSDRIDMSTENKNLDYSSVEPIDDMPYQERVRAAEEWLRSNNG